MRFGGCEITLKILYASVVVTYLFIVFSVWPKLILESLERISQVCFKLIWHILRQCESFNHSSSTLLAAMCQEAQRIISLFLSLWRPVQWWPLVVDGCKHLFPVHSREHVATCKLAKEVLVCCSDHPGNLVINYHRFIDHHTSSQWSPHRNFLRTWVAPPAPPAPRAPRLPVVHRLPGGPPVQQHPRMVSAWPWPRARRRFRVLHPAIHPSNVYICPYNVIDNLMINQR